MGKHIHWVLYWLLGGKKFDGSPLQKLADWWGDFTHPFVRRVAAWFQRSAESDGVLSASNLVDHDSVMESE